MRKSICIQFCLLQYVIMNTFLKRHCGLWTLLTYHVRFNNEKLLFYFFNERLVIKPCGIHLKPPPKSLQAWLVCNDPGNGFQTQVLHR